MRIIIYAEPVEITKREIAEALTRVGTEARHIILRRDYDHIEIDLDTDCQTEDILEALRDIGIRPIDTSIIEEDEEETDTDPVQVFIDYFRRGRFWEIHERLEKIWRRSGDPFLRGLILATIPYVKQQMAQYDRIGEAIERLERYAAETCDHRLKCLAEEIKNGFRDGRLERIEPGRCLSRP